MTKKFLDPKYDSAFKKIFGSEQNKDLLIHFLNDVLILEEDRHIQDISFLPPVQDIDIAIQKQSIVDVLCKDDKGDQYIVEMQYAPMQGFQERALHYASKAYGGQMLKGDYQYKDLKKIIFLAITNHILFPDEPLYKGRHLILHETSLKNYLKGMVFYFFELPKFKMKIGELTTLEEKWLYFLKHASETSDADVPKISGSDHIIDQAYEALNRFSWSKEELQAYEQDEKRQLDLQASFDYTKAEGLAEGLAQGLEKGLAEGLEKGLTEGLEKGKVEEKRNITKKLLKQSIPIEVIVTVTGLTKNEIEELQI